MSTNSTQISDRYESIAAPSKGLYKDNGSRFLAFAFPVETEDQAKGHIAALRKEYFDARHHCYAYRIGHEGQIWRANDDGEPSSTAGRPILGQLMSAGLSDILVVVVRYFGGIKLGVPGLIKAYRSATADALAAAERVTKTAAETFEVTFGYEDQGRAMKIVKEMALPIVGQQFDSTCRITVRVRLTLVSAFEEAFEWTAFKKS
ncbi:MAG: YigZ family protein [Bacteroidales bacterium]|nr:YigZ family protein [Bacteroidales bacterium]